MEYVLNNRWDGRARFLAVMAVLKESFLRCGIEAWFFYDEDRRRYLRMRNIHYQGRRLIYDAALRKAQKELPGVRSIAFTFSAPVNRPPAVQ